MPQTRRTPSLLRALFVLVAPVFCIMALAPLTAAAQNPFAPRVMVDERVITRHDVAQRVLFLELFGTPGDLEDEAIERLIEERLQMSEARRMGIRITSEQLEEGMEEFAGRVDMTAEEFIAEIAQVGLTAEAFSAFVEAGLAWREVLRRRFAGRIDITGAVLDRALDVAQFRGTPRVLLSEIVLPDTDDNLELAEIIASGSTLQQFAEAAELYSASETRARGGRLDWLPLANLPEALRGVVESLRVGQVTEPILQDGAILLLQLRALERTQALPASATELDYVVARMPAAGLTEELARLRRGVDNCESFATLTAHLPEEAVQRETRLLSELTGDLAAELGRMDRGEISGALNDGTTARVLMLCSRIVAGENRVDREEMRDRVADRTVSALADGLLAELRAAAVIQRR